MATTLNHWLIGVRPNELATGGEPRFIHKLRERLRPEGKNSKDTLIRSVTDPGTIHELPARHGEDYVGFYYVDEALLKASRKADINLHALELVFGPIEHAEIYATVMLPVEYWADGNASAKYRQKKRRRA